MVIKKVIIKNFRNLENITIDNASNMKYIIGNNGIGKSNLLEAINYFFNKSSFSLEDFADEEKPIEIHISLLLNDLELGYFDDFFDLDNENIINIKAIQETPIDRIEYYHIDTGSAISYQKIRNLPCVYYNSINAPEELSVFYVAITRAKKDLYLTYSLTQRQKYGVKNCNKSCLLNLYGIGNENLIKI